MNTSNTRVRQARAKTTHVLQRNVLHACNSTQIGRSRIVLPRIFTAPTSDFLHNKVIQRQCFLYTRLALLVY